MGKRKCGHSYKLYDEFITDYGMMKIRDYRCEKSGKIEIM